jgi:hypothetical protein
LLKKRGWLSWIVEYWNAFTKRRVDLFGFGDILVIDDKPGSLIVQVTTAGEVSKRVQKICTECEDYARAWLERGNRIQVWGWGKFGARDKRKTWQCRVRSIVIREDGLGVDVLG